MISPVGSCSSVVSPGSCVFIRLLVFIHCWFLSPYCGTEPRGYHGHGHHGCFSASHHLFHLRGLVLGRNGARHRGRGGQQVGDAILQRPTRGGGHGGQPSMGWLGHPGNSELEQLFSSWCETFALKNQMQHEEFAPWLLPWLPLPGPAGCWVLLLTWLPKRWSGAGQEALGGSSEPRLRRRI